MNKPEYKVMPAHYRSKIVVYVINIKSADSIIEQLVGVGADEHEFYKMPYGGNDDVLELIIYLEKINVSIESIRDVLSEHDNKIRHIIQNITAEEINTLLPEISSVTDYLCLQKGIEINMDSDKFMITCYVHDKDMFDGLGLDIKKYNFRERYHDYIRITFDSIHDLRKLKLLGIVDCIMNDDCASIELPRFVFESYPLI